MFCRKNRLGHHPRGTNSREILTADEYDNYPWKVPVWGTHSATNIRASGGTSDHCWVLSVTYAAVVARGGTRDTFRNKN